MMLLGQSHDCIHVTSNSRIVNNHYYSCMIIDEGLDGLYGYVGIVCPTIGKHDFGTFP